MLHMQAFIILSCLISVSVNFSTFLVIGKTSPVTYQVLGHLKTCLVLGFGYTLLHDPFTERNLIGILVAIAGMGLYSYFCTQESKKKQGDLCLGSQVLPDICLQRCVYAGLYLKLGLDLDLDLFQIKDKETAALLAGVHQDKESHEVKKSNKDSLV